LHWYRQFLTRTTKKQNTQITQNNTTQKVALVNGTTNTLKKPRLRDRTDSETEPGLVAFYDIQPGNGLGLFFQPGARTGQTSQ